MGAYTGISSTHIISGGKRGGTYEPSASRARSRPGVRVDLSASAEGRGRGQEGQGRLRRHHARLYYAGQARPRDEPPSRVLHPARGREDGTSGALGRELALRVEGARQLLRRDYRTEDREASGVVLSRPDAAFRRPRRLRGVLFEQDGCLLGRGTEGRGAGRGLLRGLDHP